MSGDEGSQIMKLEEQWKKDPKSQVFLALAEAYREKKLYNKAEKVAREGLESNPSSLSGYVALARILKDQKKLKEALSYLQIVTQKRPDNILAQILKGEVLLAVKDPKSALHCFKLVLFYNPTHPMALKAISKLESLTADEYDEDLFSMGKLSRFRQNDEVPFRKDNPSDEGEIQKFDTSMPTRINQENSARFNQKSSSEISIMDSSRSIDRLLSLVDAYMVRQEFDKAIQLLNDGVKEYSHHPEIQKRLQNLKRISQPEEVQPENSAEMLAPLPSRDQWVREKKMERLQNLAKRVESLRFSAVHKVEY